MKELVLCLVPFVLFVGCEKNQPPEKPITPIGAVYCTTGVAYTYKVTAIHPQGEMLEFQFDWGGAVGDWDNRVASGETALVSHVFETAGTYPVAARARDSEGLLSPWSDPLSVSAVDVPSGPPRGLSLQAASDSTVRLSWSPPAEGVPSGYRVMFKPVGGGAPVVACETTDTTCEHDPAGMTGDYHVLALFGSRSFAGAETLTTIPVASGSAWVGELSGSDNAGYGWLGPGWQGATYEMLDTTWVDRIDLYVTDLKPGSVGPTYYLASPDLAPLDSGGSVPAGRWHGTSFVELTDEQSRVPSPGDSAWRSSARVPGAMVAGCRTEQGYFAMVNVTQLRIQQNEVRLQTWFQPVHGLRLLRH
jgi:hypothetical protein